MKRKIITISVVLVLVVLFVTSLAFSLADDSDKNGENVALSYARDDEFETVVPIRYALTADGEDNAGGGELTEDAVAADEGNSADGSPDSSETETVPDRTESNAEAEGAATDTTDNTDGNADAEGSEDNNTNPFEAVFLKLEEKAPEIFSVLAFLASLLLAWAYKKGLVPLLQGGIGAISTTVSSIKETTESSETAAAALSESVSARLTEAESTLTRVSEGLESLTAALDELKTDSDEKASFKLILSSQIEMLYDIFMTSALPQYQKEAVGQRVAEMKEALGEYEK